MSHYFIKVKRCQLKEYLSCPLCGKLLREATTINECLHTFCRGCIYQKLVEEETSSCPVCDVCLGCSPSERLRPDNNLQDVRNKIFPIGKRKMKVPESDPLSSVPARRKERSLSSIVVSTTPLASQNSQPSRKGVSRRSITSKVLTSKIHNLRITDRAHEESEMLVKQDKPEIECNLGTEPESEMVDENKQNILLAENVRQTSRKSASWGGLACLAEAANRTEKLQHKQLGDTPVKTEVFDRPRTIKSTIGSKRRMAGSINLASRKELCKIQNISSLKVARKTQASGSQNISISRKRKGITESFESASTVYDNRNHPVWFALLASDKQAADNALPQIKKCYLCIKDGNVPVSYVKKYLLKKLNLKSEYEVEITCCGQPIVPSLSLYSLVEFWVRYASSLDRLPAILNSTPEKTDTEVGLTYDGASAAESIMVLIYGRKSSKG